MKRRTVSRLKQISTEINLEIPRNIRKSQGVYRSILRDVFQPISPSKSREFSKFLYFLQAQELKIS